MRPAVHVLFMSVAVMGGCASAPPRGFGPPPDFALSVTIVPWTAPTWTEKTHEAWRRPAWYVLEADGDLRAALGERRARSPLPPITRHLRSSEIAELWHITSAAGLAGPAARGARAGAEDAPPMGTNRPTAVVYVAAEGTRRSFEIDLSEETAASSGTKELAARLLVLAGG